VISVFLGKHRRRVGSLWRAQSSGARTWRKPWPHWKASAPFDERLLTELPEVARLEHAGQHVVVTGTGELVNLVILTLATAGVTARDVQLDSSSLEDAFVKLAGKNLRKEGALA
jgi:hypothetical protein